MEDEFVDAFQGATTADEHWLHVVQANGSGTAEIPKGFAGLSHAEVLALEFPPERMLVDDLVPIGAVGTIAGVPETFKSWQAQRLAVMVASGEGDLFGKTVEHSGPVGYFWQDDSTREEAERIKLYDKVRGPYSKLDIRWFLNEGLELPAHIDRLRVTIVEHGFVMIVLDSFYNVLFGKDLKDDEAERVISELKSGICDVTGCTVLIVDHMPWATQENRKRLRAYGGVFKGAAIRFGMYLDAVGNKIYVEARGNNITGFRRQLAEWDAETLELKLVDTKEAVSEDDYDQRIIDYLTEHGEVDTERLNGVKGHKKQLLAARERLHNAGSIQKRLGGTSGRKTLWSLSNDADSGGSSDWRNQLGIEELAGLVPSSSGSSLRERNREEPEEPQETDAFENPLLSRCVKCDSQFRRGTGNRGEVCGDCVAKEMP
jgi:hypothetical protein